MIHTEKLGDGIWLFRYIPEGAYGDAFTFVCTGVREDKHTIWLKGAMGDFDTTVWDAMYRALHTLGFNRFVAQRNGEVSVNSVKPTKKREGTHDQSSNISRSPRKAAIRARP